MKSPMAFTRDTVQHATQIRGSITIKVSAGRRHPISSAAYLLPVTPPPAPPPAPHLPPKPPPQYPSVPPPPGISPYLAGTFGRFCAIHDRIAPLTCNVQEVVIQGPGPHSWPSKNSCPRFLCRLFRIHALATRSFLLSSAPPLQSSGSTSAMAVVSVQAKVWTVASLHPAPPPGPPRSPLPTTL